MYVGPLSNSAGLLGVSRTLQDPAKDRIGRRGGADGKAAAINKQAGQQQ